MSKVLSYFIESRGARDLFDRRNGSET